jgi:hypothetical protein
MTNRVDLIKGGDGRAPALASPVVDCKATYFGQSDKMEIELAKSFIRECVDILMRLAKFYGFRDDKFSIKNTYDHWIECCLNSPESPIAFIKYKLNAFYFYWSRDIGTDVSGVAKNPSYLFDNPKFIIGGRFCRFLLKMRRDDFKLFLSFITSVLYSKMGMPRPGLVFLHNSAKKTLQKLTTPPVIQKPFSLSRWSDETRIDGTIYQDRIKFEAERMVRELFKGRVYSTLDRVKPFVPSTSANYILSRGKCGTIGVLFESGILKKYQTLEKLVEVMEVQTGADTSAYTYDRQKIISAVDYTKLSIRFTMLYQEIIDRALLEPARAELVALAESLKARVISKGPPFTYCALKPLQKFLWRTLREHKAFKLIGEPVTPMVLQDIVGANLKEEEKFLSVDYADATNQIHGWLSECIMREIAKVIQLDENEEMLAVRSLIHHEIFLSEKDLMRLEPVERQKLKSKQQTGQLMGGILSFPILCIANAVVLRLTKEITDDRLYKIDDLNFAVNGDDGLLKTTIIGKQNWERISEYVGLSPSVGKVYFNKFLLNINSENFIHYPTGYQSVLSSRGKWRLQHYESVGTINMGLFMGLQRSTIIQPLSEKKQRERDEVNKITYLDVKKHKITTKELSSIDVAGTNSGLDFQTFGARARELIGNCPYNLRERVLGAFIHKHEKNIIFKLPYFIPEHLGGLGLPTVGGHCSSDSDLRFARKIFENPDVFPLPKRSPTASWRFWEYAMKRFPEPRMRMNDFVTHTNLSLNDIRGLGCVEAMFRISTLKSLFEEIQKSDKAEKIYQMQLARVWDTVRKSGSPPPPFKIFPQLISNDDVPMYTPLGTLNSKVGPLGELITSSASRSKSIGKLACRNTDSLITDRYIARSYTAVTQ